MTIQTIPLDVLLQIVSFVDLKDFPALLRISKLWKKLVESSVQFVLFKNVTTFSRKPSIIWQKSHIRLQCQFINEKFYVLGSDGPQKKCLLVSRLNSSEKELNGYQFLKNSGNYLFFSDHFKLVILDSQSGENIIEHDLLQHDPLISLPFNQINAMSEVDQNGQFQIIDCVGRLFFIQIDKVTNTIASTTSVDLSQYLKLPSEKKI